MNPSENKRKNVLSLLNPGQKPAYTPAAFFLHFDPVYQRGQAAVNKHLEYFHYTGMDFVKIQYELAFPKISSIQKPRDWAKVPLYKEDFFEPQLEVVRGIVKAAKSEALVVETIYSPFMLAAETAGEERLTGHIRENPEAVKKGMETITASLLNFVRGCIRAGVDGFYVSTQGGEAYRFGGSPLFEQVIKPYDLAVWDEIGDHCIFNILHVCDYRGSYDDLTPFLDYPGQVVNCSLKVGSKTMTPKETAKLFGRPFMGGMERKGIIVSGTEDQIRQAAESVLAEAPERFILAADCTVPSETPWDHLRTAINAAHQAEG